MHPQTTVDQAHALSEQGVLDREVALIVGVPLRTVRNWRTGRRRAPGRGPARVPCPRCADEAALPAPGADYAYLLGLYLGDGHIVLAGDRSKAVWRLSVWCADDWPGLVQECARAMRAIRPDNRVALRQKQGCIEVSSYSRHWPCLFPQHGPGKKHTRKIELADWQQLIAYQHPGDFARGLFHSDGYRGVNRVRRRWGNRDHWYEYPRYLFVNESADILGLCGQTLDRLGVEWRFSKPNTISVAKRDAVARLDEFVGPKY
jgi:hypothetical protein